MRRLFTRRELATFFGFITVTFLCTVVSNAGAVTVEAFVSDVPREEAKMAFTPDTPKLYVIFKTKGVKAGDKFRGVLISDHASPIAPENGKIIEGNATLDGDTNDGAISFTRPTNNWPVGEYHVDIYINNELTTTVRFSVVAAK